MRLNNFPLVPQLVNGCADLIPVLPNFRVHGVLVFIFFCSLGYLTHGPGKAW